MLQRMNTVVLFLLALLAATNHAIAQDCAYLYPNDYEIESGYTAMVQAPDGNIYGTAQNSIFRLTPACVFTTLFTATSAQANINSLLVGPDGNLFGTSNIGGASNEGTFFKLTPSGAYTLLYSFGGDGEFGGPLGENPIGLAMGTGGYFYGAALGGAIGDGVLFKATIAGQVSLVYAFPGYTVNPVGPAGPSMPIQASDGNFYGITLGGGSTVCGEEGCGTVYKVTPGGVGSTVLDLPTNGDGANPDGGDPFVNTVAEGLNANIYGTTFDGGPASDGSFFSGSSADLYDFTSANSGANAVMLASDGNFYGTTVSGEEPIMGTVFEITTAGEFTTLTEFGGGAGGGNNPIGPLLQASDGTFYGFLEGGDGGSSGEYCNTCAEIFQVDFGLSPPVQVSLSSNQVTPGKPLTASLRVLNAPSLTMQQCYAYQTSKGIVTPLGKVPGTYNSSTKLYTFSTSFTPATAGIYNYAVTCGGVESGFATLTVGDTTQTTLTAAPNPVTPPANDTLTATVTRTTSSGTPTGSVTFSVGTTVLGKSTLNGSGVATLAASSKGVAAGTYPVVATYSGDANDISSTSAALNVTVQ